MQVFQLLIGFLTITACSGRSHTGARAPNYSEIESRDRRFVRTCPVRVTKLNDADP